MPSRFLQQLVPLRSCSVSLFFLTTYTTPTRKHYFIKLKAVNLEFVFVSSAERVLPMAGRLDLKGRSDSEEDLGISRGYKRQAYSDFFFASLTSWQILGVSHYLK